MKKTSILALVLLISTNLSCQTNKSDIMIDKSTVEELNLDRYLGTWYELARFDHSFERGLEGVTATYSLKRNGKIKVLNQGYKNGFDGKLNKAVGKAKLAKNGNPAHLKVSFFLFFYGDYFVMELDKDYQWALIGSSSDNFLWILSRKPKISDELKEKLLNLAKERGYVIDNLIWVTQK